ncbi:helix-turn-helix transcriptional regulator [Collinsella tanakaei]|nr:helix-turn-helix transcriptional regulator [Collinsella tanakaei]
MTCEFQRQSNKLNQRTVSNWELGQGSPALDKAAELARLYGVTIDDLVSDEVDVVSTGRDRRVRDLHVLRAFIGKTALIACAGDGGVLEDAEVLDISDGWMRVACTVKRSRLGSPKVERERVVRLIDIRDIEGIATGTEA